MLIKIVGGAEIASESHREMEEFVDVDVNDRI
jgi:hypothetical protein